MEYFLFTKGTIPKGLGFSHFDVIHMSWLIIMILALVCCSYHYKHLSPVGKSRWKRPWHCC